MSTRITGSKCIAERFTPRLRGLEHEECWVLTLTKDQEVIGEHLVAKGEGRAVRIGVRAILRIAILDDAAAFAVVHNHPSNSADPSEKDLSATKRLLEGGLIVGCHLLDHVICTPSGEHFSFDQAGHLKKENDEPAAAAVL